MQLSKGRKNVVTCQGGSDGNIAMGCKVLHATTSQGLKPAASSRGVLVSKQGGGSCVRASPGCLGTVCWVPQQGDGAENLGELKQQHQQSCLLVLGFLSLKLWGASGHCFQAFFSSLESHLQSSSWSSK